MRGTTRRRWAHSRCATTCCRSWAGSLPALFFHGEDDPIVAPEGSRRAGELMPDAHLVMVPDCGHWAQLEARDRFLSEVRGFLEKQS
ncbi:alpha/beta fold hydrolase [Mycobacterium sp.]|uniref:alpha/beta fold hydrolase n=1 Tax=Mycobacterium sp. TaxID=1785 RepID=UPI003F9E70BE